MKKLVLPIMLVLLMSAAGFSQQTNTKEAIISKEKEMYKAISNGDMDTFQKNLAANFVSVYPWGIIDRTQEIKDLSNMTMDSYELKDARVMQPNENVAIIVYKVTTSGAAMHRQMNKQKKFSGDFYSSSTWVKSGDGTWKAVLHTQTQAMQGQPMTMKKKGQKYK